MKFLLKWNLSSQKRYCFPIVSLCGKWLLNWNGIDRWDRIVSCLYRELGQRRLFPHGWVLRKKAVGTALNLRPRCAVLADSFLRAKLFQEHSETYLLIFWIPFIGRWELKIIWNWNKAPSSGRDRKIASQLHTYNRCPRCPVSYRARTQHTSPFFLRPLPAERDRKIRLLIFVFFSSLFCSHKREAGFLPCSIPLNSENCTSTSRSPRRCKYKSGHSASALMPN